jgi:hypothetical protein
MRAIHLAAPLLLLFATSASAAIGGGTSAEDGSSNLTAETREVRDETLTFGTVLSTTPNVSIDQIQFGLQPKNDVTLYILESELGGSAGSVTWLPDGDGTILFKQFKAAATVSKPPANFLDIGSSSTTSSPANQRQNAGSSQNPLGSGNSLNNVQTGFGINNLTSPLGPGGSGDVALDRHIPVVPLASLNTNSLPTPPVVFRQESGAEGEFGGPSTLPAALFSYLDEPGKYGEGEYGANWPQASLETEHLPEPTTFTIFALGGLGLGLGALRRAFRKPGRALPKPAQ